MEDERSPLLRDTSPGNGTFSDTNGSQSAQDTEQTNLPAAKLMSILPAMTIGIFLAAMDQTIVVSSYAAIGSELRQLNKTSWLATAYMLTLASFQPLYGKLSDLFGRKACLLTAYTIFALGCLLCGLSTSMDQLIWSRALSGIGGGGMTTVVSIIMSDIVPLRQRGTWQGILNIVFASGSVTGAPLGGFLSDGIGWRWAFLLQVPISALAIICASIALHLPHDSTTELKSKLKRIDYLGAMTLVLSIFFLLYGLERGGNVSWSDNMTVGSLCAFAAFLVAFWINETKLASEPFAPHRIVASPALIASYLVNLFGMAAAMSMVFHLSLYLQAVKRYTASEAGLWLIPNVLGGVTGSLAGGLIIQATGRFYWLTVASVLLALIGLTSIALCTGVIVYSRAGIFIGLVMSAVGNGSAITTSLISLIANAGSEDQAIATAVSYLFRSLGSVIGVSVASTIVQSALRDLLRKNLSLGHDIDEIVRRVRESLDYVRSLDPETRTVVEASYEQAIHLALWFSVALAACCVLSSLSIKEKSLKK